MTDYKRVIELLCTHLNYLLDLDLKPEYFKLAKFDKNENNVVPVFWKLLNALTVESDEDIVCDVKSYFRNINYKNLRFFKLPYEQTTGSRELLLAFAYVLPDRLKFRIDREIKKSTFNPEYNMLQNLYCEQYTAQNIKLNKVNYKDYVSWANGRIEKNLKEIEDLKTQNKALIKKFHTSLKDKFQSLSFNEILALKSRKFCDIFLDGSTRVMTILENQESWLKKEKKFWDWMNTVLLERSKCL